MKFPGANKFLICWGMTVLVACNVIILVLPVIDDLEGLFRSPAACVFLFLASVFCVSEGGLSFGDPSNSLENLPRIDIWALRISGLFLLVIFWISLVEALKIRANPPTAIWLITGVGMMIFGIVLRRAAMVSLGQYFRSNPSPDFGAVLVTDGVFRYFRHPSEIGLVAISIGAPVMLASIGGLIFTVVFFLPLVLFRVKREEAELRRCFGSAYDAYVSHTWGMWRE